MPVYECSEHQFVENLRKVIDTNFKVIVKRSIKLHDDAKHGLSLLPDCEFEKYEAVVARRRSGGAVYASKPFYDEFHKRLYREGDAVYSARYPRYITLSIPYFRVEYSFDIWGETYLYCFDALFNPAIRLEPKKIHNLDPVGRNERRCNKPILTHILSLKPPSGKALELDLPRSVLIFDVSQKLRP